MKMKWPKILTFKRTLLLVIILVAGIILVSYFLGGYQGVKASYNPREFTLDGFVSYEEYDRIAREEAVKIPYNEDDSLKEKVEKCNYISQLQTVIAEINAEITRLKNNSGNAAEISDLEKLMSDANMMISNRVLPKESDYIVQYIEESLGYGDEPIMSNGSYEFWFNTKWTTFKVVEKRTGNVWYSNPTETDTFTTNASVLRQQRSLINVYYAGLLGVTTLWDSYTYAISDTDLTGESALTPNFQIKKITDASGKVTALQVYYYFQTRGTNYTFFPEEINASKVADISTLDLNDDNVIPELILRNKNFTTDGAWEVVASVGTGTEAVYADDNTVWYSGDGSPSSILGVNGNYYIDITDNFMYVKDEDNWEMINTELLTWKDYLESNITQNNLSDGKKVYEFGYTGNGEPLAEEGINGFYYYDKTTKNVYKKASGTLDYTHVLAGKEISVWVTQYYKFESKDFDSNKLGFDYYYFGTEHSNMKLQIRKRLYSYYYEKCLYTEEDLIADNTEFSNEVSSNKAEFGIAMEYVLSDEGLEVSVLDNSITELKDFPLTTIEILPYFTATNYETEGYMVIPDGSGAIMNYNNGKTSYTQYAKMVYTTDLSKMAEIKTTDTEDLMFSMFAMVNTYVPGNDGVKSGMIVDALSGSSQLMLSANISKINDSYNKAFYSAFYRESQKITIGAGYYATTYTKWTENRLHNDISLKYYFLDDDELDYSSIAKKYRDILIERYGLIENDTTDETVLNVSLIGTYDYRNNFLGVGYTDYDSMTDFNQAQEILSSLKESGDNHINAYYLGWRKKGLVNYTFNNMRFSSQLGSKKELNALINYADSNDISLYMDVDFGEVNKYQEAFGKSRYSTRDVSGSYVEKYPYDLSSGMYDKKQDAIYVVSPRYYSIFMEKLVDNYSKQIGLSSLSIKNLGSSLASDYKRHSEFFRESGLDESIKALEYASQNGIDNITLYNPYDFAYEYTSNALEVPYSSTKYEILDYSIPLYQLVVSGIFDYAGEVINANDEKGNEWHIMHILETGSNASFTFSYEDSSRLIQTDYKYYYYTQYSKWTQDVKDIVSTIDNIGIHKCQLTKHESVANNAYKVTYSGNGNEIQIILNYSDAAVTVEGNVIPAKSYVYNNGNGWRA